MPRFPRVLSGFAASGVLAASMLALPSVGAAPAANLEFAPMATHFTLLSRAANPPTDNQCHAQGVSCYSPQDMWAGYNLKPLLSQGVNGKGETIVIVDAFGSPTIKHDLAAFDRGFGLPAPPSFKILYPAGRPGGGGGSWASETTLDVEWSHAMAPGASIDLLVTPTDETEGLAGFPQIFKAESYAVSHHLGIVISQSFGATEQTFSPSAKRQMMKLRQTYVRAAKAGVTVIAASGDSGVSNANNSGGNYSFRTVIWPASDPLVTAVGGTTLNLNPNTGAYQSERVWGSGRSGGSAGGGGVSSFFSQPSYQAGLPQTQKTILHGHRGLPDVSYDADPGTGPIIYEGGWGIIGGTSAGSPQWAGLVADAAQIAGHGLGSINPALYTIGEGAQGATAFHDITVGNNGANGLTGYQAVKGWDAASGWGTPNAAILLPLLAHDGRPLLTPRPRYR